MMSVIMAIGSGNEDNEPLQEEGKEEEDEKVES